MARGAPGAGPPLGPVAPSEAATATRGPPFWAGFAHWRRRRDAWDWPALGGPTVRRVPRDRRAFAAVRRRVCRSVCATKWTASIAWHPAAEQHGRLVRACRGSMGAAPSSAVPGCGDETGLSRPSVFGPTVHPGRGPRPDTPTGWAGPARPAAGAHAEAVRAARRPVRDRAPRRPRTSRAGYSADGSVFGISSLTGSSRLATTSLLKAGRSVLRICSSFATSASSRADRSLNTA